MNPVRNFLILNRKIYISNGVNSRGVAFILVLGFILAVVISANVALLVLSSQARFTRHGISRIQAFYAAQAGINLALEKLRVGDLVPDPVSDDTYYCINGQVDTPPPTLCDGTNTISDDDIPYNVQIRIYHQGGGIIAGTTQLEAKAGYTYTP